MAVVFFVPHVLVVSHSLFLVKCKRHEAIDGLGEGRGCELWGVMLTELEGEFCLTGFDNLSSQSSGIEDLWYAW